MDAHALLPIQSWQTKAGARVLFVESHNLPMLDVSVEFPAGSGFDSEQTSGRAALTQQLLRLGAGGLSEGEIARGIADVGARLGGRFDTDRAGASLRTLALRSEREQALNILARVIQAPEFPASVIEREKARIIAALKEADTKPDTLANRAFNRLAYRDHPYGLRASGEIESLRVLTRADLVAFYEQYYVAERAVVAMTGAISRAEAEQIAEQLTRDLPRAKGAPFAFPAVPQLERPGLTRVDHPASQAHILIGTPAIRRNDPDFFSLSSRSDYRPRARRRKRRAMLSWRCCVRFWSVGQPRPSSRRRARISSGVFRCVSIRTAKFMTIWA
jgi:zinc protease